MELGRAQRPQHRPGVDRGSLSEHVVDRPHPFDEVCSPDLVEHQFGLSGVGAAACAHVKAAIADVHRALPARIAEGRIVEYWGVPDRFALLAQTGVLDRIA